MASKIFVTISALFLAVFSLQAYDGDSKVFDETAVKGLPVFKYNIFRSFTETGDTYILNVHADIANERLQFLKKDSLYIANYVISAAVFRDNDTDGIPLFQNSSSVNVETAEYKDTQSELSKKSHVFKFDLIPGNYTLVMFVKDIGTGKKHTVKRTVEYSGASDLMISDIRMVTWEDDNEFLSGQEPLINNVVDKQSDYTGALFEIFSKNRIPLPFDLKYRIVNERRDVVYEDEFKGSATEKMQYQVLKIPLENLHAGNYRIEMEIDFGSREFERYAVFYLRWKDLSLNVLDIPAAIEQMLYIVEYDSISQVFDYSEEKKKEWFKNYWNDLEQSLSLKKNSLMDEYFRRVAYSNMNFSIPQKPGWKTDMGKVLCMMGDPDEVQSFTFVKYQRPYEVWIYYDTGTQYIFDYVGGEYRLRK